MLVRGTSFPLVENENVDGEGSERKEARKREIKDTGSLPLPPSPEQKWYTAPKFATLRYVSQYVECVEWSNARRECLCFDFAKQTSAPLSFHARFRFLLSLSRREKQFKRAFSTIPRSLDISENCYASTF